MLDHLDLGKLAWYSQFRWREVKKSPRICASSIYLPRYIPTYLVNWQNEWQLVSETYTAYTPLGSLRQRSKEVIINRSLYRL